jgi:hypothetical protein
MTRLEMAMSRLRPGLITAIAVIQLSACASALGVCRKETLAVNWPVQIQRGTTTTSATLESSISRSNVSPPAYDQLMAGLVDGTLQQDLVAIWNVPAFEGNGGIAIRHPIVLAPSGSAEIINGTEFGGWGVAARTDRPTAVAHVRTSAPVTVTSGTIQRLSSAPARYRITIVGTEASGQAIRITGDASFSRRSERRSCFE